MWGITALFTVGAFGAVLLVIALAAGWALPLLGVAIVLVGSPLVLFLMTRESGEPGGESTEAVGGESGGKPSWLRKHWWE